jgi:hypothetical protein
VPPGYLARYQYSRSKVNTGLNATLHARNDPGPVRAAMLQALRQPLTVGRRLRYFTKYQFSGLIDNVDDCGVTPLRLFAISVSCAAGSGCHSCGSWLEM